MNNNTGLRQSDIFDEPLPETKVNRCVYISGPISGTNDYAERFAVAERLIEDCGFTPINPAKVNGQLPASTEYKIYMDVSLELLKSCSIIYMLKGWQGSRGACAEKALAECLDIKILYE